MLLYPYITRALIAGVLISCCAATLGVVLVLRRFSMIGHALGDVGFAGVSLALALGMQSSGILFFSMLFVAAASIFIMWFARKNNGGGDAVIGMVATGSLSAGIIITAVTRGFNADVYNYMFGSVLAMSETDVYISVGLSVLVLGVIALLYNRLLIITYDESYAKSRGINITVYNFIIALLTALTVAMGMRMMGTLLISSLIIFPSITARRLVRSFRLLVAVSCVIAVFCFAAGIYLSFALGTPAGASIVAVNIVVMAASAGLVRLGIVKWA